MLTHSAIQLADEWHTVYQVPGSSVLTSVMVCSTKRAAECEARELNEQQVRNADTGERHLIADFYRED